MADGYCWDPKRWEANRDGVGRPIHPLLAAAIAPLLGGLFVVFLPAVVFVLVGQALAAWAARSVRSILGE